MLCDPPTLTLLHAYLVIHCQVMHQHGMWDTQPYHNPTMWVRLLHAHVATEESVGIMTWVPSCPQRNTEHA